ncbi:hypothetical protein C8J56DRAFT_909184 [Mycena floridula]|nr:hypothetical protein C8J56DRAFT_909184 [Mycena floridula]
MSTTIAAAVQSLEFEAALTLLSASTFDSTHLDDLVEGYVAACKAAPARTSQYTSFILSLEASGRLPTIAVSQPYAVTGPETIVQEDFAFLMRRAIFETIRDLLNDDQDHEISPENPYLIAALVSGSCMGTNLCTCSDQTASISEGLQLEPYDEEEAALSEKEKEIKAIHACLQTLLAGEAYKRHADVAQAVRKLKETEVVTSEPGKKLVDAALIHAEEKRPVVSSEEAWRILFP